MRLNSPDILVAKSCGFVVLLLGLVVVIGWYMRVDVLIKVISEATPMKFNSALCLMLSGIGLIAATEGKNRLSFVCGISIGIISSLTLLEYALQFQLGIDDFFLKPDFPVDNPYDARMALITAAGLFFTSLMIISISFTQGRVKFFFTTLMASVLIILGLVVFLAYLSGLEMAYTFGQKENIAVHTASAFLLLGLGTNAYMWHLDRLKTGKIFALWCACLLSLVLFLLTLSMWQKNIKNQQELIEDEVKMEAKWIAHNIGEQIHSSVIALRRMSQRWAIRGGQPKNEWVADAKNYLLDTVALISIEVIDSSYHRKWSESLVGHKRMEVLASMPTIKRETASGHATIKLTAPIDLGNGERGFIAYVPIYNDQNFLGYIAGIYNAQRLIDGFLSKQKKQLFTIIVKDNGVKLYESEQNGLIDPNSYDLNFQLFNRDWDLVIQPNSLFYNQKLSSLPYIEFIGGTVFSLVMGIAIYFAITASQRSKQINRLIATIDESPDFIGMADMDGNLLYHNNGAKKMVGLPKNHDMSTMKIKDMHPEWAYQFISEKVILIVLEKGFWTGSTAIIHQQNGKEIPVLQTLTLHGDPKDKSSYLTTIMRDITELKKTEDALRNSEKTFRSAIEYAPIGMALVSLEGKWLKVNQSLCGIIGYSEAELQAMNFQMITHPDDLDIDLSYVKQLVAGKISSYQMEKRYICKNGKTVWVLLSGSLLRDTENKPVYFIAQIQNIDNQKMIENELKFIANHDVLTGLANRKQLESSFAQALAYAKRNKTHLAVMFLDLDGFKAINDQYGHEAGDLLLVEVSSKLYHCLRETDILVRLGGDEFIVVLTELSDGLLVSEVAKKILTMMTKPIQIKNHKIAMTISIGISLYPKDGMTLQSLIKQADKALYHVKEDGKDGFKFYSDPKLV